MFIPSGVTILSIRSESGIDCYFLIVEFITLGIGVVSLMCIPVRVSVEYRMDLQFCPHAFEMQ